MSDGGVGANNNPGALRQGLCAVGTPPKPLRVHVGAAETGETDTGASRTTGQLRRSRCSACTTCRHVRCPCRARGARSEARRGRQTRAVRDLVRRLSQSSDGRRVSFQLPVRFNSCVYSKHTDCGRRRCREVARDLLSELLFKLLQPHDPPTMARRVGEDFVMPLSDFDTVPALPPVTHVDPDKFQGALTRGAPPQPSPPRPPTPFFLALPRRCADPVSRALQAPRRRATGSSSGGCSSARTPAASTTR